MRSSASTWQVWEKERMSESVFWSWLKSHDLPGKISKAVLVNGSLSPPPSKVYPGRKCYMVSVSVEGIGKFAGFGPTPGIARNSAIFQACRSFYPTQSEDIQPLSQEASSDSETEDIAIGGRHDNRCSEASESGSAEKRFDDLKVTNLGPFDELSSSSVEYVSRMLLDLGRRKGVEVKCDEVIQTGQEMIAVVQGTKLSFVGRNTDARLAQLEAALKMLDALLLLPDFLPHQANLPGSVWMTPQQLALLPPPPLPLPPVNGILPPLRLPFHLPQCPSAPLGPRHSLPHPPLTSRPPPQSYISSLSPPPRGYMLHPLPFQQQPPPLQCQDRRPNQQPLCAVPGRMHAGGRREESRQSPQAVPGNRGKESRQPPRAVPGRMCARGKGKECRQPPRAVPGRMCARGKGEECRQLPRAVPVRACARDRGEESTEEEEEQESFKLSRGLREVIPPKSSIQSLSPFESYPDPCQFTVPLPKPRLPLKFSDSLQPVWKSIYPKDIKSVDTDDWKLDTGDPKPDTDNLKPDTDLNPDTDDPDAATQRTSTLPTHFLFLQTDSPVENNSPTLASPLAGLSESLSIGLPTEGSL